MTSPQHLKSLSDSELLTRTQHAAKEERRVTIEVLHLLREVDRRRLFAARGFSSLIDYAIRELGYSSGTV
jgi:hypothetical protein